MDHTTSFSMVKNQNFSYQTIKYINNASITEILLSKEELPWPGISVPESLTPASRLIIDSVRSPKTDPKKLRTPRPIALTKPMQKPQMTTCQ